MRNAPSFESIVVTGGTGFVGRHLLEELVKNGYHPTAIARRLEKVDDLPDILKERVRWIGLDLLDHRDVSSVISAERPTVLFHLAGNRGVNDDQVPDASICQKLNVDATVHLLEALNEANTERIITLGSAEEYGDQVGPFDHTSPLKPSSAYGKSKAEATRIALTMHQRMNFPVVVLRLFSVYGPHQPRGMFVSDAISAAVSSSQFSMSEGTQRRDLVFVTDVVSALLAAARTPGIEGTVFNLGSGKPMRLLDVVQMIWHISETNAELRIGSRPLNDNDMHVTWADPYFAKKYLGWEPRFDLETGLRATIQWARDCVAYPKTKQTQH